MRLYCIERAGIQKPGNISLEELKLKRITTLSGFLSLSKPFCVLIFGSQRAKSLGKVIFRVPYAEREHMYLDLDVVYMNVPLFLALDVMDE